MSNPLAYSSTEAIWANLRDNRFAHYGKLKTVLIWVAFFLIYAATTAQDILPADSGEFQLVASEWGIAHPPGYPLYTIVSSLWTRLISFGSNPYRTNVFSAALAATTLTLTFRAVVSWAGKCGINKRSAELGGLASILLLGAAGTYWAQATIANIRMPTMLFTSWGFSALAKYDTESPTTSRNKVLHQLAFVIGLGVGHHPSILFVVIGWVAYLLLCDFKLLWSPERWWRSILLAVCAWGIPQLYLPLRGWMPDVMLNPGNLTSWSGFWNHVLARGFSGDMFAYATTTDLLHRLPLLPSMFRFQFPAIYLLIIVIGWFWTLKWQWKFAVACGTSWLIHTFVTITYRAPQTIEYLMPAYLPMVIVFGTSIASLRASKSIRARGILYKLYHLAPIILVFLLIGQVVGKIADYALLASDTHVRSRIQPMLAQAPEKSLILADWRWVTPLWAIQQIEGISPEVQVSYVYPEADYAYDEVWLNRAERGKSQTIFVTHIYDWQDWTFAPIGGGYQLYRRPLTELPENLDYIPYQADLGSIRLLGYRIIGQMQPGQAVEMQLVWQAIESFTPPPSFTGRLWENEDILLAAADRYLGTDTEVGEIKFTQLHLQLPYDHCPVEIKATIGVYTVDGNGFIDLGTELLTTKKMICHYPSLPVVRAHPGFISTSGPFILGIDYDMHTSSTGIAYLHFTGPGETVNVRSNDALVTIPTLRLGERYTALVPLDNPNTKLYFSRENGMAAHLLGLPLPKPKLLERYTPFGNKMVLVGSNLLYEAGESVLNLHWLTTGPVTEDYVVSARILSADESWEIRHDMQPGLGAIPTLKWVNSNARFLDPHLFINVPSPPAYFDLTVYEPFRMTPLISPYGSMARYMLP